MSDVDDYRERLRAMRRRLIGRLAAGLDEIRESVQKPGEQTHVHTHNADMDVEGLDESVGVSHALARRLQLVEETIERLNRDGQAFLSDERQRERIDALLDAETP